jgi:Fe-S-cluster-containing dehydrogenase component/anaerobic selenocysteine-containing dehydrogenase
MHNDNGIWVSPEDLNQENSFLQATSEQEFSVENLADDKGLGKWEATRRDFLKVMGFGLGAATVAASCEVPIKKAIPYVTKPDEIVPGVANYFASSFANGGDYNAILVKTREGRPIKIEGNSLSPINGSGTSARAQAMVLSLYDINRIKNAGAIENGAVKKMEWVELDRAVKGKLAAGNVRIVSGTNMSPSAKAAIDEFVVKYPTTKVIKYDPVSSAALLIANEQTFGQKAIPSYHFDQATTIVSFGADFLGTWISPVEFARDYSTNRKIRDTNNARMSRHYQVESNMSLTGSNADHRILVKPSEQGAAIIALYNAVTGASGGPKLNDRAVGAIKKVAAELLANKGKSLVVSGSNNVMEQVIVNKINSVLGNVGTTLDFNTTSNQRQGNEQDLQGLISEMNAGQVGTVIVWGANPAYELSNADAFKAAFAKVGNRISCASTLDETTLLCTHVAPATHQLESWGDVEPKSGHLSMIQPTIAPLFATRQPEHSLLEWSDSAKLNRASEQPYYEFLKQNWQTTLLSRQSKYATPQSFWDMSLHDGVVALNNVPSTVSFNEGVIIDTSKVTQPSGSDLEISFYETVNIGNGQYAHNPWLQEMPDPVTRTVWGNYLSIPVEWDGNNRISGWNELVDGDTVEVEVNGKKAVCTVVRTFGQMPGTVAIALGGGREAGGTGINYGVNVNPMLMTDANGLIQYYGKDVKISAKVGIDKEFACVQHHHTMGVKGVDKTDGDKIINVDEKALGWNGFQGSLTERSVIKQSNLSDLPKFVGEIKEFRAEAAHLNSQTLYPDNSEWFNTGLHWGMYVDLNACIGCGSCQVACVSENNVPVVGKPEVHRHHEMTWLRIDRYFYGDFENPNVVYQPMMCQHCDNAPCENVCPVAATNHSMEGINQMAYNRCIGTRYCANNCPYKVRRFNWFDYTTADLFPGNEERTLQDGGKPFYADNLVRMVMNPDVTVRTRGVIEKCSFCVQRIQEGKLLSKRESRAIGDNDVRTACQTACPTGAITFGNKNNPDSELSKLRKSHLAYQVLEEINVRPGVEYSAKVTNRKEDLFS